jgi:hypothetical protein
MTAEVCNFLLEELGHLNGHIERPTLAKATRKTGVKRLAPN